MYMSKAYNCIATIDFEHISPAELHLICSLHKTYELACGDHRLKRVADDIIRTDTMWNTYGNGLLHSFDGKPSVSTPFGFYQTHYFGITHSFNDSLAYTNSRGVSAWYQNDKLHRDNDLPAVTSNSSSLSRKWPGCNSCR